MNAQHARHAQQLSHETDRTRGTGTRAAGLGTARTGTVGTGTVGTGTVGTGTAEIRGRKPARRQRPGKPTRDRPDHHPGEPRQDRPAHRPGEPKQEDRPAHRPGEPQQEDPLTYRSRPPRGNAARTALGRYGEQLAARRLTEAGLTILERNWRAGRSGEIDIVARDRDTLVICEVKTRRGGTFEHPMAAVTPAKARRLRGLADRWVQEHGGAPPGGVRIDIVGVLLPDRGAPEVEHAQGVA